MSDRLWHKHYHRAFLEGVHGLGAAEIGAYIVVLNLIYSRGGRCPDDPKFIGAILGESTRAAGKLIERLVEAGKLHRDAGFLVNEKATSVLGSDAERHIKLVESGAKGGRERANREAELRKNNGLGQGSLNHTHAKREIRDREEDTPSSQRNTTREPAAADLPTDASPPAQGKGAVPSPPSRLASVAEQVRKRAKMTSLPADVAIVRGWLADNIDPEKTIYPIAEKVGARGKAVRTYGYLDQAVREAHTALSGADDAEIKKLRRIAEMYGDNPSLPPVN